ncbi:hypothetical protein GRI38_02970 [Altererythrobacter aurantiacus]|uniref:Uncharacterized protein n=1 Tax=Parapontixanthobacter aurantiacus TaxID=1463599 RepID=A0A844Z8S6_9SPHN|nr:hypothetical protein [Parapontixanthobacter aurantiacus]MXO84991.1 hypothetical protein [Parapontixanthobacter aurantiacus]
MRRALVLTTESARNSFRARLPHKSLAADPAIDADSIGGRPTLWLTMQDMRGVASTYFVVFAAALAFFA